MQSEQIINILHIGFIICLVLTILFAALSVFFFFQFKICDVFNAITGRAQRKSVQQMEEENAKTGKLRQDYYSVGYEEKPQEEIILGLFPDGILCMDSALYYYGYIEKRPYEWSIAISKNTSKSRFRMEYPVVKPYYTEPEVMELGVTAIPFAGGEMKIYEKERLICDCLKYEERLEREDLKKALLAFINEPKKDIAKLMEYARARKVVAKIQSRIGVWL